MKSDPRAMPLVAVDIGNSRVKFGLFESAGAPLGREHAALPEPNATLTIYPREGWLEEVAEWVGPARVSQVAWWIGSVQRSVCSRLVDWLRRRAAERLTILAADDLPLSVSVPRPDMVGIDRLLGAVAANRLRSRGVASIVIGMGTAITIDLIANDGTFMGGAIMPGIGLSARALHEFTDLLPLVDMEAMTEPPGALGRATVEAMHSGLFWGAVGAAREITDHLAREVAGEPHVFVTGGASPRVAPLISPRAVHVEHLNLSGIAITATTSPE